MRSQGTSRRRPRRRWLRRLLWLPLLLAVLSVLQVAVLRVIDPPFSSFMAIRQGEALLAGERGFRIAHDWRRLEQMAPSVPLALIAAEDQRFAEHSGFDRRAIADARARMDAGGRMRGGSTISQQTAKNLFLWTGSGWSRWLRKALETWYTFWIELLWPKQRIIEVYANVAEFGDGVYGAQAAARTYFGRDADALSAAQAARLAAVLPAPRRYSAAKPGPYVQGRTAAIQRHMRNLGGEAYLQQLQRAETR